MTSEMSNIGNRLQASVNAVTPVAKPATAGETPQAIAKSSHVVADENLKLRNENQLSAGQTVGRNAKSELESAVADLKKKFSQTVRRELNFRVHDEVADQVVIEVLDHETKEVIRQIPSEDALKLAEQIKKSQDGTGALINAQA